ncbi:sensor histidine kinase [Pantoea agglomerans]|uniref:sensor histidine kinase n=1 Tax=Enterobacter agglomerans TaxID=549 RepID=UPI003208453F
MSKRLIDKKPFDFSARVTLQLGRESISSSTVAVSELIKNAYDADAEKVNIKFYLRQNGAVSTLVIKDDGLGMNTDTLAEHWLKIGTNNKAITEFSKNKRRILTGAKGLGRLGIDRLCKRMILFTKESGQDYATQLNVDWRRYENTNKSLSQIMHNIYEFDLPVQGKYGSIFSSNEEHGTYLILIGLRDVWDNEFINALSNELRLLISPYKSVNDFSISLKTQTQAGTNERKIDSQDILSGAAWKVNSSVDKSNNVKIIFTNNLSGEVVEHRPIPWKKWIVNQGETPLFGPLKFDFYYLPRLKESLSKVNLSAKDWSKFMELNRGVRIYRDDFRVRPYGEPSGKGDWLDIGYRKAQSPGGISQGGWRISPIQLLGAISISRNANEVLNDQANREGIVENDAFFQMRTFAIKVIEMFEELAHKQASSGEDLDLSEELEKILQKSSEDLSVAFDKVKKVAFSKRSKKKKKFIPNAASLYQRIRELERAKTNHEKAVEEYYSALKKDRVKLEEEKNTLSNLASIGILSVCFGHEIRTQSFLALQNSEEIKDIVDDYINYGTEIPKDDISKITDILKESVEYINKFSQLAIENIKPDKRTRKKINVPTVFEYIFDLMSKNLTQMGVNHIFDYIKINKNDFNIRSFEIDWESIAINFLTNSLWALNDKSRDERLIKITFERIAGTKLRLSFEDSGCGLEESQEENIFLPMKSSKRDRTGNVIGTGMGLSIVQNQVIDNMAGNVFARSTSPLGGAGFYIDLNQDV